MMRNNIDIPWQSGRSTDSDARMHCILNCLNDLMLFALSGWANRLDHVQIPERCIWPFGLRFPSDCIGYDCRT